jgi:hypothetical protein
MGQRIAGLCVCARDGAWEPTRNERGLYGGVEAQQEIGGHSLRQGMPDQKIIHWITIFPC